MKRIAACLALGLLTGCVSPGTPITGADYHQSGHNERLASGVVCHIGPDGGPVGRDGLHRVVDRGIGGTGAPKVADRGIGGTGIVGIITGFASICVDGLEVHYDSSESIDIDGTVAPASALRVGQVVAIEAQGPRAAPTARKIFVQHEISGRIEAVEPETGVVTVAGQRVAITDMTRGAGAFRTGDGVLVSGLRRADGVIVASLLDNAPKNRFFARGQVVSDGAEPRVGALELRGAAAEAVHPGQFVTVSGSYLWGRTQVDAAVPDPRSSNPAGVFGQSTRQMVVQGFVRVANGSVWLNGTKLRAAAAVQARQGFDGLAIVALERSADGSFTAVHLRRANERGTPWPAPHPNRAAQRPNTDTPEPQGDFVPSEPTVNFTAPDAEVDPETPVASPTATPSAPFAMSDMGPRGALEPAVGALPVVMASATPFNAAVVGALGLPPAHPIRQARVPDGAVPPGGWPNGSVPAVSRMPIGSSDARTASRVIATEPVSLASPVPGTEPLVMTRAVLVTPRAIGNGSAPSPASDVTADGIDPQFSIAPVQQTGTTFVRGSDIGAGSIQPDSANASPTSDKISSTAPSNRLTIGAAMRQRLHTEAALKENRVARSAATAGSGAPTISLSTGADARATLPNDADAAAPAHGGGHPRN